MPSVKSPVGLIALLVASMGIYGTVGYIVVLRTREVGIRIALGAQKLDILGLMCAKARGPCLSDYSPEYYSLWELLEGNARVRLKILDGLRARWYTGTAHLLDADDPRERQRWLKDWLPSSASNAAAVRFFGTDLLTVRIDLDA